MEEAQVVFYHRLQRRVTKRIDTFNISVHYILSIETTNKPVKFENLLICRDRVQELLDSF